MSFNESSFDKRLQTLQTSQESIQTLSLYCFHHRSHHVLIVQRWLRAYRNSSPKHRLTLFYLANDIIQSSARKSFVAYKQSFLPALKEALVLAKNDQYRPHFERVLKIWSEREVFEPEYHEQLDSLIRGGSKSKSKPEKEKEKDKEGQIDKEALLQSFRTKSFMAELERFQRLESSIERAQSLLPNLNFNVGTGLKEHLKDRSQGQQISSELDDTHKKLSEFVLELERHLQQRRDLILLLEQAKIFYETQLQEAGIVEKAYRTFGERIKQVKEQLDVMKLNLPSSPFSSSPSRYEYSYREERRNPAMDTTGDLEGRIQTRTRASDVAIVPNQSYIGANLSMEDLTAGRSTSAEAEENPGASTPTQDEAPAASASDSFSNTLASFMAAADNKTATSGAAPVAFNPIEFLNQFLSSQPAAATSRPPATAPVSTPTSMAPPAMNYFSPPPPQQSYAPPPVGYPAPGPGYPAGPPGFSGNIGPPMIPGGHPPPFGNLPPFPGFPPPPGPPGSHPMTPTTPQQQSPFGMPPSGAFSAPPPPVTSVALPGAFFGAAPPTSAASNPGSDIENFPPTGSAPRNDAAGNHDMDLGESDGPPYVGGGGGGVHETSISSANSAESIPSASMGHFDEQEIAGYLEDYTSNPDEIPESLYQAHPKRDGPQRMGANSQNLTVISPHAMDEGAGSDRGHKAPLLGEGEGMENGAPGGNLDTPRRIDLVEPRQRFSRFARGARPRFNGPPPFSADSPDGGMFRPRNFYHRGGPFPPPRGPHGHHRPMHMQQNGQY